MIKREQQRRRQAAALGGSVIQRHPAVLVTSPGTSHQPAGRGNECEMKLLWMNPRLRELVALAALAAFGCGLALSQGDLLFVAIFAAACAVTIIEAIRRLW